MKKSQALTILTLCCLITGVMLFSGIFNKVSAQALNKPFISLVSSDSENRYFEVDLKQLPTFFEKAFFLDLLFKDTVVIVQNSNLKNGSMPLICNNKLETAKVKLHIEGFKEKAIKAGIGKSESEKAIFEKQHEKYR
jgi:hypothetical protein